jgi:hypothetical protein
VPPVAVPPAAVPPVAVPPTVVSEVPVEPAGLEPLLPADAAVEPLVPELLVPEPVVAEPVVAVPAAELPDTDVPAGDDPLFGPRGPCTGPMNTPSTPSWRSGVQVPPLLRICSQDGPFPGVAEATPCGRKTAPLTRTATVSGLQASCPNMSGGPPDDRW